MPAKKKTAKKGAPMIDVRSAADLPAFNSLLKKHPMIVVFVHMDGCGHCERMKPMWQQYHTLPNLKVGLGSMHYDQAQNTNLHFDKPLNGFPSVLVVKKAANGEPSLVKFKDPETGEVSNAMNSKDAQNPELMKKILTSSPETVMNKLPSLSNDDSLTLDPDTEEIKSPVSLGKVPNAAADKLDTQMRQPEEMEFTTNNKPTAGKGAAVGGSLYASLLAASRQAAPALLLTGAAALTLKRRRNKRNRRTRKN